MTEKQTRKPRKKRRKRKVFLTELQKQEAMEYALKRGVTAAARKYNIHRSTMDRMLSQHHPKTARRIATKGNPTIARLRDENTRLKLFIAEKIAGIK